jgi:hypothetical protein
MIDEKDEKDSLEDVLDSVLLNPVEVNFKDLKLHIKEVEAHKETKDKLARVEKELKQLKELKEKSLEERISDLEYRVESLLSGQRRLDRRTSGLIVLK